MKLTEVNSDQAPSAEGGYSQAMLTQGMTNLLFISGQIPETKEGDIPSDFESQCRLVWANILAQLHAAQMGAANLLKVTIFLSSREYADLNSRVRQEVLGKNSPALTVIITGIFDERWLLEIDAIAAS
ncbi:MAG: RidA family protein [Acidiferrobacterales bacterium]|nr:RidA family protein [Acidiferrobacterales bacterium]